MPDLYPAQIDGIELAIETLDDEITKAITKHEYPHRDGALLEDMGQHARTVKIKCHFWDDTYEAHQDLLDHLDQMETIELVHPKYGPMRGSIESVAVHHDDSERHAAIDLTFTQGLIEDTDDTAFEDVEGSAEAAWLDSIEEQKAAFGADMLAAIGLEANAILSTVLDPAKGIVEQLGSISSAARQYLQQVESFVGSLEATCNLVANPANSLMALISYGSNLPGRVIGALARCAERYTLSLGPSTPPVRSIQSLATWSDDLSAQAGGFAKTVRLGTASQMALNAASVYKADEELRRARRRAEGRAAFDVLGRYTPPEYAASDPQPMTMQELEITLAVVRAGIQTAIDLDRGSESLKRLALTLMTHVNTVKLERDKLSVVTIGHSLPLHLICLHHSLPYNAAERLLTVNRIRNPNEVSGGIVMPAGTGSRAAMVSVAGAAGNAEVTLDGEEVLFGGEAVTFGGDPVTFGGALHAD
ncbi:MAG: DNA circularization N-terminal domain-containing protein [Desulfobulbus sp.]|nr:DNA circularization N-terminal domain-containing protein [Desulfobulbus sp.]